MTALEIIQLLNLQPHPEGGYYKETYKSEGFIEQNCLPKEFYDRRRFSTSIYYLLERGDFSAFHRIKSDELWHFYYGGNLLLHLLDEENNYQCKILGNTFDKETSFQIIIPAGTWFAAEPATTTSFTLAGCTVSPGFDFADFELANKKQLIDAFPNHMDLINRLCR